ncbi:hypothetical protein PWT90_01080 [Aphanocladium album]|nr:hypothetical protein PWT90_01080 [Aphanocladium album]
MAAGAKRKRHYRAVPGLDKALPYTEKRDIEFLRRRVRPLRVYHPQDDSEVELLCTSAGVADLDMLEFRVRLQKRDITHQYETRDMERPCAALFFSADPALQRNIYAAEEQIVRSTTAEELLENDSGPRVVPSRGIPDPDDDEKEYGFRERVYVRAKPPPRELGQPRTRKSRRRKQSEHPEEADIDIGPRDKRPRLAGETAGETAQDYTMSGALDGFLPTPSPSPDPRASCDRPLQSVEGSAGQIGLAEANLLQLGEQILAESPVATATPTTAAQPPSGRRKRKAANTTVAASSALPAQDPAPPPAVENGWRRLPYLVRQQIYRCLMVREAPIRVHAS